MRVAIAVVLAALAAGASPATAQDDPSALKDFDVYLARCAPCHGDEGKADGPAAETMFPRPRVFADNTNYKFRTTANAELPTREDLLKIIANGIPGTAMPGFGHLPEQTRQNLVSIIEAFAAEEFKDPDYQEGRKPLPLGKPPEMTEELIARGKEVYNQQKCYECHGEEGRGDWPGWNEKKDAWGDPILPADLTRWHQLRGGHQIEDLFRATLTGLNGTSMPNTEMSAEDRWAMSAYLKSLQQEKKERQDQVVLVKRVEELPTTVDDEKWDALPSVTFPLVGQVVEKPRLLWPSVTEVFVKAAYDDESIVLLLAWHDPDASPGTNLTEFPPESDPITETFVTGDFPDQAAVQFPAGRHDGSERPFFLWGDSKREVNLWWWGSHLGDLVERNASGKAPTDQDEASQGLTGEVKFERGRYRMLVRRDLTTPDPHDVQFAPGEFVPIAFNVWQGSRGEIGRRRNISTWYLLVLEPPTGRTAYVAPFLAGGLTLTLLLFIVTRIYRTATRPAPRLYERLAPAVSVVAIGALVLYASVPGLYGFFTGTVTGDERARIEEGRDIEFRAIVRAAEKNFASYRWTDASRETVKLPIDRAMQQVLEEARAGAPSLVPAVGAHDQPTMPPPQPEPAEPAEP